MTNKITAQDELCQTITKMEPEFKKALPPQIPSSKFVRVTATAIRNNPSLADSDKVERASLLAALHKCAQTGLLPDGREAAIVPFGGKAQFMPMVAGLCRMARNSGEIKTINAQIVYKNDEYQHWIDETGEHFKHVPARENRGDPSVVYAFCQTRDGGIFFEEMTMKDIEAIEKMSKQAGGPWKGPFRTEMMRKSAIRRLLKYRVPSSTDLDDAIRVDDEPLPEPPAPKKAETTSSKLRDVVTTTMEPTPEEERQEEAIAAGEPEIPL